MRLLKSIFLAYVLLGLCHASDLHYQVKVRIDPASHYLKADVDVTNPPAARFYLNKSLRVRQVFADGKRAAFHPDRTVPPLPYSPGSSAMVVDSPQTKRLHIVYEGAIQGVIFGVNQVASDLVELAIYSDWYPIFDGVKTFSFAMTTDLPRSFVTEANAERVSKKGQGLRTVTRWTSYGETFDIALLASPLLPPTCNGPGTVEVLSRRLNGELVSRKRQFLSDAFAELTKLYGAPAVKGTVRLVYSPRAGWGYSRIPLIVVSERRALEILEGEFGEARDFRDNAHELAHFWWVIADPGTPDDWLNEGFAELTSFRLTQQRFGSEFAAVRIAEYRSNLAHAQTQSSIAETETSSPDREVNRYDRATLMLLEAQQRFGEKEIDCLLRAMFEGYGQTHKATTADFLKESEKVIGPEASEWFREKLYEHNTVAQH